MIKTGVLLAASRSSHPSDENWCFTDRFARSLAVQSGPRTGWPTYVNGNHNVSLDERPTCPLNARDLLSTIFSRGFQPIESTSHLRSISKTILEYFSDSVFDRSRRFVTDKMLPTMDTMTGKPNTENMHKEASYQFLKAQCFHAENYPESMCTVPEFQTNNATTFVYTKAKRN